jgi:hypothetical protein
MIFRAPAVWEPLSGLLSQVEISGLGWDDVFFLVGVIIVWYLAGRALDERGATRPAEKPRWRAVIGAQVLLLMVGGILFFFAINDPTVRVSHLPDRAIPTLFWAAGLIFFPIKKLLRTIRPRLPN